LFLVKFSEQAVLPLLYGLKSFIRSGFLEY